MKEALWVFLLVVFMVILWLTTPFHYGHLGPYDYDHLGSSLVRIHKVTGEVEILTEDWWYPLHFYHAEAQAALEKLLGRVQARRAKKIR